MAYHEYLSNAEERKDDPYSPGEVPVVPEYARMKTASRVAIPREKKPW